MKRIGGCFARIATMEALAAAAHRAAMQKRTRGDVRDFFADLDAELARICLALHHGRYSFGPYKTFAIRDPKTRTIHAPSFADRVVHHAMIGATGPVLERGASAHSHACRLGLGQAASLRLARQRVRYAEAFLKLDIVKFYDNVDHARLMAALRRRFREERVLELFGGLLASYEASPGRGLPIGALTSQYLGNFYLDGFDRWAERQAAVQGYQRYMDDMLFFGRLDDLRVVLGRARSQLAMLGLRVKHGGVLNRCASGVPWLGFTLYSNRTRLDARGRRRLGRRLRAVERELERSRIDEAEAQRRATALFAHARHGDDLEWRRALLARRDRRELQEAGDARHARRLVEQPREEVPLGEPQQEEAWQPQPQPGLPRLSLPWHEGRRPTDDAASGALAARAAGDETCGRAPAGAEIQGAECPEEKAPAGDPPRFLGER